MSDALIATVRKAWADAAAVTPGERAWRAVRIATPGPLAVLAAIRENDGAHAVLFEAPIENAPSLHGRFEADGISMLEERNYPDRIYRIAVTLERPDLGTIFGIVVADLIEAAAPLQTAPPAVSALFSRLAAWQAFLRARRSGLGREAIVGLVGELLVLRRLAQVTGWGAAVEAWMGPTGGLHDFLRRGTGIEAKTSCGVASLIDISSLDQLDDAGLSALLLAHVHIAEAAAGFHLPGLVDEITRELTVDCPPAVRPFQDTLLAAGYADVDADLYVARIFQQLSLRFCRIGPSFPRFVRAESPEGIVEAAYRLDVRALLPHLLDETSADAIIILMGNGT